MEAGAFTSGQEPKPVRKEAIHEDKIKIFNTVSRFKTLKKDVKVDLQATTSKVSRSFGHNSSRGRSSEQQPGSPGRLVSTMGKVKIILNDSFGLIEFEQPDQGSNFCLFDTFDLYLEGGKTAAGSKLTMANCLTLDMEVRCP